MGRLAHLLRRAVDDHFTGKPGGSKPYLVSKKTGVPMATTISALIAERLTDIVAILGLMALSVGAISASAVGNHTLGLVGISS